MKNRTLSLALGVALLGAGAARGESPFSIGAPLAARAIFGCSEVTVADGATVRSEGVSSYSAKEGRGHVASNGDIAVSSRAVVMGDVAAGPGHTVTVAADAAVSGLTTPAAAAVDCRPVDLVKLAAAIGPNDNAKIPKTALGKSALSGPAGDALVLAGRDSVTLPAGTYVFSSIDLSSRAHVMVAGEARVFVMGDVHLAGNSALNAAGGAFRLRLFTSGPRLTVESSSTLGAFVYAPSAAVFVDTESRVLGTLFASAVTVRHASAVIRVVDDTPPVLTLLEPGTSGAPVLSAVRVRGLVRDPETAVTSAKVNGQVLALADDGSFDTTVDATSSAEVRLDGENAMGLVSTVRVSLCSGPPQLVIQSPANGSLVGDRIGSVTGTCGTASSVAVNGRPAAVANGAFRLDGIDFGPDGLVVLNVVASSVCAQTALATAFTLDTQPPAVAIDTPTSGSVVGASPLAVSGTFVEPNLASITVNGVAAAISGSRFTATVPVPAGISTLIAEARDKIGHVGLSTPVSVTLDTQAASVVITSPASGTLTGDATATVSGTADMPGLASVRVAGRTATLSGKSFTVSGVPLVEGDNRLVAEAIDASSRSFLSQPVVVTLDSLPPDVALDTTSFPLLTKSTAITVSGTVSDPHLGPVTVNGVAALVSGGRFTATNVPLVEGDNPVRAHAVDTLGHSADSAAATVNRDTQGPAVTITSPASGAQLANASLVVTGTASDPHLAGVTVNGVSAPVTNGTFTTSLTLGEGDSTLVASAVDSLGNSGASPGVPVTVDTIAPVVSIDAPANTLTGSAFVTVTGTVLEPHLLSVTVAGVPAAASGGRFVATNVPLVEGTQQITAVALDTFGHRSESGPVTYRLDSTPPVLTIDKPPPDSACFASGAPIAVSGHVGVPGSASARPAVSLVVKPSGGAPQTFAAVLDAAGTTWSVAAVDPGSSDGFAVLTASTGDALGHDVRVVRSVRVKASTPAVSLLLDGSAFPGSAAGATAAPGETPVLLGRVVKPRALVTDGPGAAPPVPVLTLDGAPYTGAVIDAEGTHLLAATVSDCAGHSASRHALFTIDVTPPRLLSTVPADGVTLGAAVTSFSGTSDPDLASAAVDGVAAGVSGGAFSLVPFSSKEGTNALAIVLVDRAGNRSVFSRSFNVKSLAPSVEILEGGVPLGTGATFFRTVTPVVRANDPSATVAATLNGSPFVSGTPVSAAGTYTVSATATDALGHAGNATASFKIDLSAPPTIDITAPPDRAVLPGPAIAVTGTASASVTSVTVNGRAATLAGAAWTVPDLVLPPDVPVEIIAIGADALGRTATAIRQVTVRSVGPQVQILDPPNGFRTNRKKIDVVGAVVGGPSMTANGTVVVAGATLPLDALGTFRAKDVALIDGANTLVASAVDSQGRTGNAQVVVTTDTLAPLIAIMAEGQPLVDGASFARAFTVHVEITDNTLPLPIPVIRLNGLDRGATAAATDLPIAQNGGYILSVVARDAAGNESRAERSFVLASGGCSVSALDPSDGAVVAASAITLHGKSGDAQTVKVTVGGQTFTAQLADGTFAAGGVPLPIVGDNTLQIACTDRSGATTTTNLKLTRLADGPGPVVRITAPANGARQTVPTAPVAGTVSDPSATVLVNGVKALVAPAGTFSLASLPLVEGPNVFAARALDAAGRSGEDRVVIYRDSAPPKVTITSPPDGAHVGLPGAGPAAVTVTGAVDLTNEPNLSSVVVSSAAGSVTATVDPDSGAFFAAGVPLVTSTPGSPQTLTATATDTLSQVGSASVSVIFDPAAPALVLSLPIDLTRFTETSPPSFPVAGEAWAKDGAQISLNGGALDPATLSWEPAAADGRRHVSFAAQVTVPAQEGPFGLIARVEEPAGAYANDRRLLYKDVTAPTVIELSPADGAKQVDANEIPLALFSEPVKPSSLGTVDGLTLTRVATGDKSVGTFTVAGNAVAFVPGAALARGEVYLFRAGPGVTDLAGHPLAAAKEARFTVATLSTGVPPVLDPVPPVICATQIAITGTAAPNAAVRLKDGDLTFSGNADASGRFSITIPLSGNGFHAVHASTLDRDGAGASPEATVLFRVDCSSPSVLGASFDRSSGKITVAFSEAMGAASLTVGGTGSAITVSKADDPTHAPQAATVALSADGATATLDLGTAPGAWWQNVSVRLLVGPPAADASGNALGSSFETVFFAGGGGDLSGGFLSGEAYDDESGRPLAGAEVKLFASGAALPGSVPAVQVGTPVASSVTDGRGRFSLVGDVAAGRYALVLSRSGYSRAVRRLALEPAVGAVPFDSRLTPLGAQGAALLHAATGGTYDGPAGSGLSATFAAGALSSPVDLGVRLTALSGQGLPEPLPLGWTPLAAAELRLVPGGVGDDALPEGTGTPFTANAVHLTLTLPSGVPSNAELFAARYDVAAGAWLALPIPVRATGAGGADTVTVALAGPGPVAVIAPDVDPATRPPVMPTSLDAPLIGTDLPSVLPALAAAIGLDPPIVSPTGRATARVLARSADGTTPWPSGLAVQAYLDEKLILSGGGELYEAPFSSDLILYHPPLAPADVGATAPGAVGSLTFRISPSPRAAQVLLDTGYENVRLFPFTDQLERGQVLGPAGGSVSSPDGVELFVPESALAQKAVVRARLLSSSELAALPVPAGYSLVAAVRVDLSGFPLARGATLKLNAPAGLPADAVDDPRLVLASFVDQPDDGRGAFARVVARVALLPAAGSVPAKLVGAPEVSGSTLPLSGITGEGVFLFLHANAPIGFVTGRVTAPNGAGYAGSRVTTPGLGTADLSQPGGLYALSAPAGSPTLNALHPTLGVSGTATVPSLPKGQIAQIDIILAPTPPRIVSLQPPAGATNQPVGTTVAILFSAPLDPASVTQTVLTVELANTDGTGTGLLFGGNVALSSDRTTVAFSSARPLPPGRTILASLKGGIRSFDGTPYAGTLPVTWTFTTSTAFLPGGNIHPEKIRLLLPVNGTAQIVGADSALPLVLGGTTPWSVWADVDGALACPSITTYPANTNGGFTATVGCPPTANVTLSSRVFIHVLDPTGTQAATWRLGPFVTPDGTGFVAPPGEETVFTTIDGIQVTSPAAAFDVPTLVKVTKKPVDSLGVAVNPGLEMAAVLDVDFEGTAHETLRLRIPVVTASPVGGVVFAGKPIDLPWGRKLQILDLGRLVDDGKGGKLISTLEADQPEDSAPDASTPASSAMAGSGHQALGGRRAQALPKKLLQSIALEFTARATAGFIMGATLELSAITGHVEPAIVGATFFVLYNALADAMVFQAVAKNWNGRFVLPSTGSAFTIVKRDLATGWILSEKSYSAIAPSPGRFVNLGDLEPAATDPPRLIDASPVAVIRFKAPTVLAGKEENLRLRLDVEAHSTDQDTTSLRAVPGEVLPDLSTVELYNLSQTSRAKAVVQAGDFNVGPLGAKSGEDLLAAVSPSDVDADDLSELSFSFSRPLASVADPATLVTLTDCGELNRSAPGPPACPSPLPVPLNVTQEANRTRLRAGLFGPLARGHLYRVELKSLTSDSTPSLAYPPTDPTVFSFATRSGQSGPIGSTVGSGVLALGDTNSARDLLKFGNLLLVGSASGKLLAMDASDPVKPVLFARLAPEAGDQLRAFASDGHNRLFYNTRLGASWAVKAVRVEDVWQALPSTCPQGLPSEPAWLTALPCFAAVPGGVKSAFALGSTTGLTPSEFLTLTGSLPTGTPSDLQILVDDDTVGPYPLEEFFDKVPGSGTPPSGPPSSPDQFYSISLTINTAGHVFDRGAGICGEPGFDKKQRVTIDDLTTGQSWSVDVPNPSTSGMSLAVAIRARKRDQIQVRYNKTAIGYLAIVGSGVSAFDLNRFYDTLTPATGGTQGNKSECGRRLGTFEGAGISFPTCGRVTPDSLAFTPALAVATGKGFIDVFSVLTHFGAGNLVAASGGPGSLQAIEMKCLVDTLPASTPTTPAPSPSYRAVTLALNTMWIDRHISPGPSPGSFVGPQTPVPPSGVRGDLAFYSLGPAGIDVYDVTGRGSMALIGRFWAKDHTVYRLASDAAGRRLFAGGQDKNGNPIIDVWDISQANGGPSKDGVFPDPAGSADTRLLFTLKAPWDTNHIGLEESTGFLYTWGVNGPGVEGGFVVPTRDPGFIFSGLYRPENESRAAGATPLPSVQVDTQDLVPLGVQTQVSTADEADPEKSKADERTATAAFKVRISLPGTLGEKLVAKVQTLRSLPDARFLSKDDVGPLVAAPGGGGWPERDVFVTLRRLVPVAGTSSDRLQQPFNLYESDEVVLLLADPRAKLAYWKSKQGLKSPAQVADEKTQCRRCGRPSYLPNDTGNTEIPVKELLAAGPWVRAYLAEPPGGDAPTAAALDFFRQQGDNFPAPSGAVQVSGHADEVPSPIQISLAEPALNPAVWSAEAGTSVSLVSGEAILAATDHAVEGRGVGFVFDRTYRSGVLGYGPLGAAGWNSSLFAHLRMLPHTGEMEFHDGGGRVWKFSPPALGGCVDVDHYESDGAFCIPKGLYVKVEVVGNGAAFRLVGRNHDTMLFDSNGRLLELSDRHRRGASDPSSQGNTLSLFYDGAGYLVRAEDELGRSYKFTYDQKPLFSGGAENPQYGLLTRIEDFATPPRVVGFIYDDLRRLLQVQLPDVTSSIAGSSYTQPTVLYHYDFTKALQDTAPLHGPDFPKFKLTGFRLPDAGADRVTLDYVPETGRVTSLAVPPSPPNSGTVAWQFQNPDPSSDAGPLNGISLVAPWQLRADYTFTSGRINTVSETVETLRGTDPSPPAGSDPPAVALTTTYVYLDDGRIDHITWPDGHVTRQDYQGTDRLEKANVSHVMAEAGGAPTGTAQHGTPTSEIRSYVDNIPETTADPEGRAVTSAVSVPSGSASPGYDAAPGQTAVSGNSKYDPFGRMKEFTGAGSNGTHVTMGFGKDAKGRPDRGFASEIARGAVKESLKYDEDGMGPRGNVTTRETSFQTSSKYEYDEWDRPVKETLGLSASGDFDAVPDAIVTRAFDPIGHLKVERRRQMDLDNGEVETVYEYNDREQLVSVTVNNLAQAAPGQTSGLATGKTRYSYNRSGQLSDVTSPHGVTTHYEYDAAGRVKSEQVSSSGIRKRAYDEMGRTVWMTDGDIGVWRGRFDAWGRMYQEDLPTGASIEREYDAAGGIKRETTFSGDPKSASSNKLAETLAHVTSFGAVNEVQEMLTASPASYRVTLKQYDGSGRLAGVTSGPTDAIQRTDLTVQYDDAGRPVVQTDGGNNETHHDYGGTAPWPVRTFVLEAVPGSPSRPKTVESEFRRDAFGRVVKETRSSGGTLVSIVQTGYDQVGNVKSVESGIGSRSEYLYDGAGRLIKETRPTGGSTKYGYDLDGRVKARVTAQGGASVSETDYGYDGAGRLASILRPDGTTESFTYNGDDTVDMWTNRSGIVVTHRYDAANRLIGRFPGSRPAGSKVVVDGGDTYDYDEASRLRAADRIDTPTGAPGVFAANAAARAAFTGYDAAGRPAEERIGARDALKRFYDTWSREVAVGVPAGVGRHGVGSFSGYTRDFDSLDRLVLMTANAGGPKLGARWDWGGTARLYGITTDNALKTAHRMSYLGSGLGAQPGGTVATPWQLGTISVASADPKQPVTDEPTTLWGQFGFGYRTGDGVKRGREVMDRQTGKPSLFSNQGWSFTPDNGLRLQTAEAGRGTRDGSSAPSIFEKFDVTYGLGDEVNLLSREGGANSSTLLATGAEGRIAKRNGIGFEHDLEGRRQKDDRFSYVWSWRGELLSVTVNDCWPAEQGSQPTSGCPANQYGSPYAKHQIRYEYDALGSLLAREHLGAQATPGDDTTRSFIERREYLWDGSHLMAEVGKAQDGTLRWRKSYVPGASGLDDAVQERIEIYSLSGVDVVSDTLYTFLRDEQNSVVALVEEKVGADPASPPTPVRYHYSPYGEAHAETGSELLLTRFDSSLHGVTKPDGTTVSQTTAADAVDGGIRLTLTLPPDPSTLAAALLVEKRNTDGTWGALNAADLALGQRAGAPEELELLPLTGFTKGATYRVGFQSLKDTLGRTATLPNFALDIPTDGTPVLLDRTYPLVYDSYFASGTTASGAFPGGQNLLFQGLWTDPVTGMGYARNRWYDARNAVWLSQDPLEDKDSPNLYGFVGARPHELTDPMGTCAELDDIPCGEYLKEFGDQFLFQNLWETTRRSGRFLLGEGKGAVKAVPNLAKGVAHVAMHPVKTIQALGTAAGEAIADPTGTAKRLGNAVMNADPDKAAEFTGGALALAGLGAAAKTTEGLAALGRLGRAGEVVEAVDAGSSLAKYGDLGYVEGLAARASRFALRRAQAGGATGRVAGRRAEEIFEKYAYQLEQRLMAAESPFRITLQPAADAATGARALARTRGSFVGRWVSGTKRLDYGFYESVSGGANSSRILSGGDFTVSPGGAFGIPAEYSQAFPGSTIFGIDPLNIVKGP